MDYLKERDLIPAFRLQSLDGREIGPQDYKGKRNLVIIFFDLACEPCVRFLADATVRYGDYRDLDAEILAVAEAAADELRQTEEWGLAPLPVLADPDGRALRLYSQTAPAIFVADRFGEIQFAAVGEDAIPDQEKVLSRIHLIELECPECGVTTWQM